MSSYRFYKYYARTDSESYVVDKKRSISAYKGYMFSRLAKMFHYTELPPTLPKEMLEFYLMSNGTCLVSKVNDNLYCFLGSFGGEPDPYYRPTKYVVANPALKFDETYTIFNIDGTKSTSCVLMRNDVLWQGLNPLISRYATLLAENTITLRVADIMLRVVALISSPDDKTKAAADIYINNIINGKLSTMAENRFFDGVKMQSPPSNNGSYLTQFIELQQYLMGQFYNEIGVQSAYNMKREAINEAESTLSEDTLFPLVETMLECRQEDISQLNTIFGTNIEVGFDSIWRQNIIEQALGLKVTQISPEFTPIDNSESNSNQLTNEEESTSNQLINEEESIDAVSQLAESDSNIEEVIEEVVEDMLSEVATDKSNEEMEELDEAS